MERCVVRFEGRVQGVGFRFSAARVARRFAVTGYVRNCPDGSVEMVVEGEREEVQGFVAAVAETMQGYISRSHVDRRDATGEFVGFEIRH